MIRKLFPAKLDTGALQTERSSSSDIEHFLKKAAQILGHVQRYDDVPDVLGCDGVQR